MTDFAIDRLQHQGIVEAGASVDILFGPPTPGAIDVMLYAVGVVVPSFAPRSMTAAHTPGRAATSPASPSALALPTTLVRPGIGPAAGFTEGATTVSLDTRIGGGRLGPGGITGGGIFDPGGGLPPPPPPPTTIDPAAFRVEVINPGGDIVISGAGRTQADLPTPADSGPGRIDVGAVTGGTLGGLGGAGRRWTLRITNTSTRRANLTVNLLFHGQRPILQRDIDLEFLNEKLDLLFNVPQPFQIAFRNREVGRVRINNSEIPIVHTFVALEASSAWRELHPDLATVEKDLGARVFTEETATYAITVHATVHDGALAFKADVAFPSFVGRIDVLNVIDALGHDVVAGIGRAVVDLTPVDRPTISIRNLALDVFLVLRPGGVFLQPGPIFEVITRPRLQLAPDWATVVVDALLRVAFERFLPEAASAAFRTQAAGLLSWLLGDGGREVVGSEQSLTLNYAGDPPRPPVLSTDVGATVGSGPLDPGHLAKIDHIVVLMMENRSFDHMLGFLSLPKTGNDGRVGLGRSDVDGLRGDETNPADTRGARARVFSLGTPRAPTPGLDPAHETRGTKFRHDPGHSYEATAAQRGDYDIRLPPLPVPGGPRALDDPDFEPAPPRTFHVGRNQGFVLDFARVLSGRVSGFEQQLLRGEVMGYHPAAHVPTYHFLAEHYAVCDRWFASHPGHTWPNRFVSLTGRLNVGADGLPQVNNPPLSSFDPLEVATIFDHLSAAGVEWRYYEHDFCMLRLFSKYTFDTQRVLRIDDPERGFFALAQRGQLPPVVYIEPDLTDIPPGSDDHPPADITAGQALLRRVHDALAASPQWSKTLLLVTYDEHGGFYDHVFPASKPLFDASAPQAGGFAPIGLDPATRVPIDHYGFRVPAFVVSPWVPAGSVGHDEYDHASLLKTIIARFLPQRPPDMGLRVALARDVGTLLSLDAPRPPLPGPRFDVVFEAADTVALRLGAPEEDFRAFMTAVRARWRGAAAVDRQSVLNVLRGR